MKKTFTLLLFLLTWVILCPTTQVFAEDEPPVDAELIGCSAQTVSFDIGVVNLDDEPAPEPAPEPEPAE